MRWFRQTRLWLVLGLLLLIVSLVGARYINGPLVDRKPDDKSNGKQNPKRGEGGIYAIGYVDTKSGQFPLFPSQAGEVVEVFVKDGEVVKRGQPLFRVDAKLFELQLQRAEFGVKDAHDKIEQAKRGLKEWELQVEAQKLKIEAKKSELSGAEKKLKELDRLKDKGFAPSTPDYVAARDLIDALQKGIAGEETMLKLIEAKKPVIELQRAERGLSDALNQQAQAQLAVDKCVLTAPSDGTIVRVAIQVGNKFGQQINANMPPIYFRPKGEIIIRVDIDQEWAGRVKVGQKAEIFDAANSMKQTWKGTVTYLGDTFMPPRDPAAIPNPFQPKQENVLECRVSLDPGQSSLPFINQKVRVHIGGK